MSDITKPQSTTTGAGRSTGGSSQRRRPQSQSSSRSSYRRGGGGKRGYRRPKFCYFCKGKYNGIDYKEVDVLQRFLTDRAKIRPRRQTGTCAKHQRKLSIAIKRARHVALLPFSGELPRRQ